VRRDYELGFILNPEVSEEQTSAILERIEKIVKNYDGQVVKVNQWGRPAWHILLSIIVTAITCLLI